MKVVCDACHTIYDLPEGKEGVLGCPYCENVNRPQQERPAATAAPPRMDPSDHGKTMLGPMDGQLSDETTAVRQAVAGKMIGLGVNLEGTLIVLEGEGKGKRIALTKSRMTFGRKQADVILTDPEASRQHCALLLYGDFAVVKDLGSANGTKVNHRIVKEGLLKSGDTIQIGTTVFQFMLSSKTAQSVSR
ncbi:MAG TPA: FHA domain-containing protein [Nitrospiria bacterium]|nr:FHA domain-containing protein [Nitrospiria bacterium]HUK57265.1 FHA domain-containing protein [Nitrospiria bacterium]